MLVGALSPPGGAAVLGLLLLKPKTEMLVGAGTGLSLGYRA